MYGGPERDTQHYVRTRVFGGDCCVQFNTLDSTLRHAAKFRRVPNHTFCDLRFPSGLDQLIHRNTGGNPLFMTAMVDDLLRKKSIDNTGGYWRLSGELEEIGSRRPESLRQLIEGQLDRLSPLEQRILEASAVVGSEFTARLVAAALGTDTAEVEERCNDLVRRHQFLNAVETEASHDPISCGSFERSIPLPESVKADQIKASYKKGVLELTAPLPKESAARKVPIRSSPSPPRRTISSGAPSALLMEDEHGIDEKILAVPFDELNPYHDRVENYTDLPPIMRDQIELFFRHL
jgi:hypothetical protein